MAHEQTANKVALVQTWAMHAWRGTCGDAKRENAHFVQGQFMGGEIHKLKIQIVVRGTRNTHDFSASDAK